MMVSSKLRVIIISVLGGIGLFIFGIIIYALLNTHGYLVVDARENDFKLYIDDKEVNYTVNEEIQLKTGKHNLKAVIEEASPFETNFEIKTNQETVIKPIFTLESDDADFPELRIDSEADYY